MAGALLLLLVCAGVSVAFIVQRGGLALPTTPATESAASTPSGTASPSAVAAASPTPTDAPSPSLTASPAPSPTPSPTVVPSPSPSASIGSRVALLTPCPDAPNCYLYRVRTNDILIGIAYYFGVPLATIYQMNPRYANGAVLRTGDLVRLPPPTR